MDYGTYLKQTKGNLSTKSVYYRKQSPLLTSNRRIRWLILKELINVFSLTLETIVEQFAVPKYKAVQIINLLKKEEFVTCARGVYILS